MICAVFQVLDCYQSLGDWQSVIEWQESVVEYRQDSSLTSLQSAFHTDMDPNYVK